MGAGQCGVGTVTDTPAAGFVRSRALCHAPQPVRRGCGRGLGGRAVGCPGRCVSAILPRPWHVHNALPTPPLLAQDLVPTGRCSQVSAGNNRVCSLQGSGGAGSGVSGTQTHQARRTLYPKGRLLKPQQLVLQQ